MKQYLFVYGTLKDDIAPAEIAPIIRKLKRIGDGFVFGRLYDLGNYPGAILEKSTRHKVFGRIYELPDDPSVLAQLDEYEEFFPGMNSKSLFVRKQVFVHRGNQERIRSWIYLYNKEIKSSPVIAGGDFAKIAA